VERSPEKAAAPRTLTALLFLGIAELVGACSRTEVGRPSGGQSGAPPLAAERGPGSADITHPGPATSALPGASAADEAPAREASFLEPVGMPMSSSMAAAAGWLNALRVRQEDALTRLTRYPFDWRDTGAPSCNAKQPAATTGEFSPIIGCLLRDSRLRRALTEHDRAGVADLPIGHLQDWAQPWRDQAPAGTLLVNAFIKRSDMQLDIDLWIKDGLVQALWTHFVDGTSQVELARGWLKALERRDLPALAEVTSYPFEVRDSGREAVCGERNASNRAGLAGAVQCLFDNRELVQALESRAPFVEAGEAASIPNWAERWWQASKHQGLSKVSAGVSNPSSYSFDMILLVGPDGVRAFWKSGSLESRD
jgi:hypothetical protein